MSTLPSRYRRQGGVLDQFRERVEVLQRGSAPRATRANSLALLCLGLSAAVVVLALAALDARADRAVETRIPFDGSGLVSAAGIAPNPRDFAPPGETQAVDVTPSPAASEPTPREQLQEMRVPPPPTPRPTSHGPRPTPRPLEVVFEDEAPSRPGAATVPTPSPRPTLNLGTRIPVRLLADATTALNGAPVSAAVASDVVRDGRVILPAGTVVHGDAFATPESDSRAQVTWSALVLDGHTVRLAAATLGADDQIGVPGRLARRGSRPRRGVGTVLGALGRAVTFGAFGSGGVAQRTASETATRVGSGLDGLGQEWTVSDKAIRVAAGTLATLVLRADVELP